MTNPTPTPTPTPTQTPIVLAPKVVDESVLVRQLAAAEGVTIFSDRPIQGERPNVELGHVRLGQVVFRGGAFIFAFIGETTTVTEYLAHQMRSIAALRGPLLKKISEAEAQARIDQLPPYILPNINEGNEGYNVFAEEAEDGSVRCQMRREQDVLCFNLSPEDALAWGIEVYRIYQSLSMEERDARLVKIDGAGKAVQVPIERMKAEGTFSPEVGLSKASRQRCDQG